MSKPKARVYAYLINCGRVWVESIDDAAYIPTAFVRFDYETATGRGAGYHVALSGLDFSRE